MDLHFRIRVDVPVDDLAEMLREAGHAPTPTRLKRLVDEMQSNMFDDKYGGCPAENVMGHITDTAHTCICDWEEDEDEGEGD